MPHSARRVALLAPMRHELRPLLRRLSLRREGRGPDALHRGARGGVEVVACLTGIGTRASARATLRVLDHTGADHAMVVGIAGAIAAELAVGALVVPEKVVDLASGRALRPTLVPEGDALGILATGDALVTDADEIARLAASGIVAVDMETASVASICEDRGLPWSVFRAISDRAGDPAIDPALVELAGPDGGLRPAALARFVLSRPRRLPDLVRLGRSMARATEVAAAAAVRALDRLAAPAP